MTPSEIAPEQGPSFSVNLAPEKTISAGWRNPDPASTPGRPSERCTYAGSKIMCSVVSDGRSSTTSES